MANNAVRSSDEDGRQPSEHRQERQQAASTMRELGIVSRGCKAVGYVNGTTQPAASTASSPTRQSPELALPVQRAEWDGGRVPEVHRAGRGDGDGLDDIRVDRGLHRLSSPIRASGSTPSQRGCSAVGSFCLVSTAQTSGSVPGDVVQVHQDMVQTAESKNVWLVGGGDLVGQFHDQVCSTR